MENTEPVETEYTAMLKDFANPRKGRIQEADFVRFFLNGFAGEIPDMNLSKWLDVAGSYSTEVDVMNGEEVLYTIPAIAVDIDLDREGMNGLSVMDLVIHANKLSRIHPSQGIQFINDNMVPRLYAGSNAYKTIERWNSIFERYGKPRIVLPGETPTQVNETPLSAVFDDIEDV